MATNSDENTGKKFILLLLLTLIIPVVVALQFYTTGRLTCIECPEGFYWISDCTANNTIAVCKPCEPGTYSSEPGIHTKCAPCDRFCKSEHLVVVSNCNSTSNLICGCPLGKEVTNPSEQEFNWRCGYRSTHAPSNDRNASGSEQIHVDSGPGRMTKMENKLEEEKRQREMEQAQLLEQMAKMENVSEEANAQRERHQDQYNKDKARLLDVSVAAIEDVSVAAITIAGIAIFIVIGIAIGIAIGIVIVYKKKTDRVSHQEPESTEPLTSGTGVTPGDILPIEASCPESADTEEMTLSSTMATDPRLKNNEAESEM